MAGPIVIVDYDPAWPVLFAALRDRATAALGALAVAVEHVGSTAVPGLAAKPIIDLDVVIPAAADLPAAVARLAAIGYRHQGDLGVPGRAAFAAPPGAPPHHLYVCAAGSAALRRHLAFRDALRARPEAARAYAELKRAAARRFRDDREGYTGAKDAFVATILQRTEGGTMGPLGMTWLGQSGYRYEFPTGIVVCIDPYLSYATASGQTRERLTPIVLPASQLAADVVITTHDHVDHFDEHSLRPIAERPATVFVGPSSCREHWLAMGLPRERFLRLDRGESLTVAGVRLTATHAEHSSGRARDAIGVVMEGGGCRVYQVGDSEYVAPVVEGARGLRPDLMTVPINGRGGNMDHRQAAQLTQAVGPRVVIPMHYGMFATNTADPQDFIDACRELGVAARIAVLVAGRRFDLETAEDER